jgi:SpoIID/LytB domain protein
MTLARSLVVVALAIALAHVWFCVQGSGFKVRSLQGAVLSATENANELRTQNPNEPSTLNPEPRTLRVGISRPGGGYTVTTLPLEAYVSRVLAGEAARDSQPSALEALAITIRTFALANRGRHRADGFDLCDQTHCQVVRTSTPATERAAQATAGQLLLQHGAPASVYYTASCGGRTEIPSQVWPGAEDPPFLPSRDDEACQGVPAWTAEIQHADLLRALRASGFRGDALRGMTIASRNASGRVSLLSLDGLRPHQISGQDLRVAVGRTLGWQLIKSTAFDLRKIDGSYRFNGHGFGHGVGLCVIGSARLAERGQSAQAILARYFPGLEIGGLTPLRVSAPLPPSAPGPAAPGAPAPGAPAPGAPAPGAPAPGPPAPGAPAPRPPAPGTPAPRTFARRTPALEVLLSLPDEDEGERAAIERQTAGARDDLARTLGVSAPGSVTLRFHPTTDDYEKVTGRAWFTSGTVVDGELHLLPLVTLRERGVLARTIRHELVHIMTDSVLGSRPVWVREGAAIYFAGEQPIPGEPPQRPPFKPAPRASCPDDAELLRPVSAGALSNAYARARACFAKQIEAGKAWRDVR